MKRNFNNIRNKLKVATIFWRVKVCIDIYGYKKSENRGRLIIGKLLNYFFLFEKKFKELCIYIYIDFV